MSCVDWKAEILVFLPAGCPILASAKEGTPSPLQTVCLREHAIPYPVNQNFHFFLFISFFFLVTWNVDSWFSHQRSNLHPLQWKVDS